MGSSYKSNWIENQENIFIFLKKSTIFVKLIIRLHNSVNINGFYIFYKFEGTPRP